MAAATTNATKATNATAEQAKANASAAANVVKATSDQAKATAERVTKLVEVNSGRAKEINAAMMDSSKAGARVAVNTYALAARNLFDMQRQMTRHTQVQWVKDAVNTQIQFAEDVTNAWAKAARQLLK